MTRGRPLRPAAALLLVALAVGACAGPSGAARSEAPAAGEALPPGWGRLKPLLEAGQARAAAGDLPGLHAVADEVDAEGLSLLRANVPNTVPRHEIPRFLEGRAAFGRALVEFAQAREERRDGDLARLFQRLADAWHAWMAVIRGLPPERAV